MRVIVACVGRAKNTPEQELCDTYLARARAIGPKLGFSRIDLCIADTARRRGEKTGKIYSARRVLYRAGPAGRRAVQRILCARISPPARCGHTRYRLCHWRARRIAAGLPAKGGFVPFLGAANLAASSGARDAGRAALPRLFDPGGPSLSQSQCALTPY